MKDVSVPDSLSLEASLGQIADEFTQRLNQGEQPTIEEYALRYPQLASVLREVLPALQLLRLPNANGVAVDGGAHVDLSTARPLGDFSILREVGRGGMGVVYEAIQLSLGRRVALKVLPFAATLDARQLQRFQNEARAAAQLHHAHIVPVYGVGSERGTHYYAMQFIEGKSLATLIQELRAVSGLPSSDEGESLLGPTAEFTTVPDNEGAASTAPARQLPTVHTTTAAHVRHAAHVGVQTAEALDHAHQLGVVHRDIKPANLLLDGRGELWVTDFGLAQVQSDARLTATGDVVGTLRYMSPEQALARRATIDHRTDIYSLGATLYELLTLEPPFAGQDRHELLRQIAYDEPTAPRRRNRAIPFELQTIVLKAMAKMPTERYATALELADDLRRFLEDKPIQARRPNFVQRAVKLARRHKPLVFSLAVSLVVLFTGLFAGAIVYARKNEQARLESEERLYDALLDHAGALRVAREPGYRARVWEKLHAAAQHGGPWSDRERVRAEVLACLGDPIGLNPVVAPDVPRTTPTRLPDIRRFVRVKGNYQPRILACTTPDADRTAAWCEDPGILMVWRDAGAGFQSTDELPLGRLYDLKLTPDGQLLVAGCEEGVAIWPIFPLGSPTIFRGGNATSIAIDPRGQLLAAAGRQIDLWSLLSNRPIASFKPCAQGYKVEFSADGKYLLATMRDQAGMAWPVRDTPEKQYLQGHRGGVPTVVFSPDGRRLASVSKDLTVRLWDSRSGDLLKICRGHKASIESVSFSPDGRLLATGDFGGMIRLWDASTGEGLSQVVGNRLPGQIWRLQFDPAGKFVVAGGMGGVIAWPIDSDHGTFSAEPLFGFDWPGVYDLAIHPRGRELVILDRSRRVAVYDWTHDANPRVLPIQSRAQLRGLCFDGGGKELKYLTQQGTIGTWHWPDGGASDLGQKAFHLALTGDGNWLATASQAHEVVVYNRDSGQPLLTLPAERSEIWSLAWSPDGSRLAVSLSDGGLVIWDMERIRAQLADFEIDVPSTTTRGVDLRRPSCQPSHPVNPGAGRLRDGSAPLLGIQMRIEK